MTSKVRPGGSVSIGDRPPPKGFGTRHIYWEVPSSGYFQFAAAKETRTRVRFAAEKLELKRSPNPVLAETPRSKNPGGQDYLVPLPPPSLPSDALLTSTAADNAHTVLAKQLQAAVEVDALQKEHARLSKELRKIEFMTGTNSFQREQFLLSTDQELTVLDPPRFGCGKTMMHFPCLRSKPRFTLFIKNEKKLG